MTFKTAKGDQALRAQLREVVDNATSDQLQSLAKLWNNLDDKVENQPSEQPEIPASLQEPTPEELERQLRQRREKGTEPIDHQIMHEKILKGFREV